MAADMLLEQLWSPIVAVTAAHEARTNGLISSTALNASLLEDAPRVSVHLSKPSLTHELVLASGALAIHLLPCDDRGLELFRVLGTTSGHTYEKLAAFRTSVGTTGSPILEDAVAHVEARVVATLDGEELTIVLADVVADAAVEAPVLTIADARERLPAEVLEKWERRREVETAEARRLRAKGVPRADRCR